jgi:hypothetical protein
MVVATVVGSVAAPEAATVKPVVDSVVAVATVKPVVETAAVAALATAAAMAVVAALAALEASRLRYTYTTGGPGK